MEDIRIYDFEFNLLHIEHKFNSSLWTLKYNDFGTFEASFNVNSSVVKNVLENEYLVAVQGNKQAIITGYLSADNMFTIYGRTPNWILTKRVIDKFNTNDIDAFDEEGEYQGVVNAKTVSQWLIENTFSEGTDGMYFGDVPDVTFEPFENGFWRTEAHSVNEVISECLERVGAGHEVFFDVINKKWVFNILFGEEKITIVSQSNKNAYNIQCTFDIQNYCCDGWYEKTIEGETENENEEITETYTELTKIPENSEKHGIYRWEALLSVQEESEAYASLKEKKKKKETAFKLKNMRYSKDYNLGDIFKVQTEIGGFKNTSKQRVTAVNFVYEPNNITEEPIFEEYEEVQNGV